VRLPYKIDPTEWGAYEYQDPRGAAYNLPYAYGRSGLAMDHAEANDYAKRELVYLKATKEAYDQGLRGEAVHEYGLDRAMEAEISGAMPENSGNTRWLATELASPRASLLSDRPAPRLPIPTAETVDSYNQLRLPLTSRLPNGKITSERKVRNPEVVAASLLASAAELATGPALTNADQLDLMALLQQVEQQATNEPPAAPPTTGELPDGKQPVDPLPQRTPTGRRLAGGYAVTGGLGLLGLLGLAALTDPYSVKPPREPQPV